MKASVSVSDSDIRWLMGSQETVGEEQDHCQGLVAGEGGDALFDSGLISWKVPPRVDTQYAVEHQCWRRKRRGGCWSGSLGIVSHR